MKKVFASLIVVAMGTGLFACGGMPGGECKFNKGQVADVQGSAKAFLDAAMDLKKTNDALEAEWSAEIKAMAGDLKVDPAGGEEGVLAKLNANVTELKAKGQCDVTFKADLDAAASGSADAKGAGAAGTDQPATGSGSGSATGAAHADVKVDFDMKCKAEASVKADLDVTVATVKAHFPKLLGISIKYKDLLPKIKAVAEQGSAVMGEIKSNIMAVGEVKCAVEAVTGIKAEARVSFSVHAEASAKGEAKAG
ncbi:MAG: hypothetical protein NVS3B10_15450 [Polyangiales bacterium]